MPWSILYKSKQYASDDISLRPGYIVLKVIYFFPGNQSFWVQVVVTSATTTHTSALNPINSYPQFTPSAKRYNLYLRSIAQAAIAIRTRIEIITVVTHKH